MTLRVSSKCVIFFENQFDENDVDLGGPKAWRGKVNHFYEVGTSLSRTGRDLATRPKSDLHFQAILYPHRGYYTLNEDTTPSMR